jgi:hypothetical protein
VNSHTCSCDVGWGGPECETAGGCTGGANGAACANGGSALGATGSCSCRCVNSFSGNNCDIAPTTTTTAATATAAATATVATTTTTIYDPGNVDCVEEQDDCTAVCQGAVDRTYAVLTHAVKNGKACTGPTDCLPGEGTCPTSTTTLGADSTDDSYTTRTTTTTTNATPATDASADKQTSSVGKAVGIVIGLLVLLALVIGALLHFRKKKQDLPQALEVRQRLHCTLASRTFSFAWCALYYLLPPPPPHTHTHTYTHFHLLYQFGHWSGHPPANNRRQQRCVWCTQRCC